MNMDRFHSAASLFRDCNDAGLSVGRRAFLSLLVSLFAAACAPPSGRTGTTGGIVVLDWALAETLVALGHIPAGVVAASDWSRFVVDPPLPEQVADLGLQQELNFELIASMRPDLILISPFLARLEPQLKRIAPTRNLSVYDPGEAVLARRIQIVKELAALVGATARAQTWLAQVEAELQRGSERLARLQKRPVVMASFVDNRHVRVYGGNSLYAEVLTRLGSRNGWTDEVGYFGFSTVGIERLARLGDIEFVAVEPVPADIARALGQSPLWQQLPFVQRKQHGTIAPVFMYGGIPSARRMASLLTPYLESRWT
jgi:iron complex transport system substrate-binding protein